MELVYNNTFSYLKTKHFHNLCKIFTIMPNRD